MDFALKRKRALAILIMLAMVWTTLGITPAHANAAAAVKVVLVGDLQTDLGHSGDWDPAAAATEMIDIGNGYYTFKGVLPAGKHEYKVAVGGNWDENYGFSSYTNPKGVENGGNIVLELAESTEVTFYYNHNTHRIADSTYYSPIAANKLPRIVGNLQKAIGDSEDWKPEQALSVMEDADFDSIYTITKDVPKGTYEFKILLGTSWDDLAYPQANQALVLPADLPVTFKYNANDHIVETKFTVPVEPDADPVPANHLRVHYNRVDGNYENQGLWLWDDVKAPSTNWSSGATPFEAGKVDSFGAYVDISLADKAAKVGFLVVNRLSGIKEAGDKAAVLSSPKTNEVWIKEGSDIVSYFIPVDLPKNTVRIHYTRDDNNQSAYGLWLWGDVAAPSTGWPKGATVFPEQNVDRYGAYVDIPLTENAESLGMIVLNPTLDIKDGGDKVFNLLKKYNQLWINKGDDTVYVSPYGEVPVALASAEVLSEQKLLLWMTMTAGLDVETLKKNLTIKDKNGDNVAVNGAVIKSDTSIEVDAKIPLDQLPLSVTYSGKTVSAGKGWRMMDEMYNYEGNDLGATYSAGSAVLKLWAPKASSVFANVYDKNDSTKLIGRVALVMGEKGVWSAILAPGDTNLPGVADLKGYFYQYEVTNDGITKRVLDPYAKSMAEFRVNSKGETGPDEDNVGKAAIIDLNETDPNKDFGFADIDGYEQREDAIIWEAHIRDFTSDPTIEGDLNARWGSYSAFIDKLEYIKSLGVTHIQLLPVMAWYYGDEANMTEREMDYSTENNEYNWGYDPHSYFSPDGAYSENAKQPELRVKELKGLIDAIHEAGMGVLLDVVYTHMAKADFLNDIVPNYYAFQDANGNNIGGFGNNLATSHKMAEKLMVDSVKYWFDEYKIDGMRFDMMGDATYDSIQHAYDAAASINPKALFIGEGWKTFGGAASDPSLKDKGADQAWMDKTDSVGVFSDEIRNELKSGYGNEGEPRFITGGARSIDTIFKNIKAQPGNTPSDDPGDMVQYIEAHDNLPLYDVIAQSIKKNPAIAANDLEIHKRVRLGNMLVLTSQGTAFLHAGQEYGRTKQWLSPGIPEQKYTELFDNAGVGFGYFIHDSYDSSDAINRFDWEKATNAELYPVNNVTKEYTAGLIQLRKYTNAFRLGDMDMVNSNVTLVQAPEVKASDLLIGYKNKATDGTGNYYVFMNADSTERTISLTEDLTSGTVLADDDEAGITAVAVPSGFELTASSIKLQPLTAVIIKMEASAAELTALELNSASYTLQVGEAHETIVYAKYSDGSKKKVTGAASYSSEKPAVAKVAASGRVTAIGAGTTTITVSYGGKTANIAVKVTTEASKRYVQFNYIRPDGNYKDWNIWTWNTGAKDGIKLFDKIENGIATAMIEVAPEAVGVGFVLRKGEDWDTAKQDIGDDRVIPLTPGAAYTKVNVNSMISKLDLFPSINGPHLEDGDITFLYRDDALFKKGQMGSITGVKVKVNGVEYDMVYDAAKELYTYTLAHAAVGDYEYSFLVTKDGDTVEQLDPNNALDGNSVVTYRQPAVTMSATVNPGSISSNENAVLTVQASGTSEEVAFRSGYLDLTALGGPAFVDFDTELMAQSIAVKDNVTAGTKQVPITLVDVYGNKHSYTGSINVKARTYAGALDFDWDEARIYFALTDRFADGDATNNADVDKTHLEAYHGGDFRGMIDKLDYLKELGINTLWITPVVDNIDFNNGASWNGKQYGYHGYWAKDFTKLDEHLGDMNTFKELIEKAHDNGIKIMVDVVLNHTGYGLKGTDNIPGVTQEDKDRFNGMLRTNGLSADVNPIKGELAGLPDFKTEDPAVRDQIIEWQTDWLNNARTERGDTIDYFRVDTVKHVESTTWKAFKNALTAIDPSFKMIGEQFGATVDGDAGLLRSGQMDSLLDFGFKNQARDFANGKIDSVDAYLADRETKLDNTSMMGQFLSSHDEDGFLSHQVGGDKGKLKVAAALQITAKGQPVIYYGEELGRSGANAGNMSEGHFSENRGDMPWDQLTAEQALHEHYTKLLNIRAKFSKIYAKGTRTKLAGSDELAFLAFNKAYGGENVVTIINTAEAGQSVTIQVPFAAGTTAKDEYSSKTFVVSANQQVTLDLPGRDAGGTVILSGVSSTGTNPGPSTGTPSTNTDPQIISESSLQNGVNGTVAIVVADGKTLVQLPFNAASLLGKNDLELSLNGLTVRLPNEVLAAVAALSGANAAEGSYILFEAKPIAASAVSALLDKDNKGDVKAASNVFEFKLSLVAKDGKITSLTKFEKPITLTFKIDKAANRELIGIYYVGDDGKLAYIGGLLKEDAMTAEVFHFSKYAVLEWNKSFVDVGADHWASSAIKALAAKHIVTGISDTQFAPQANVTRAEFAAMLVRALEIKPEGKASFADVSADKWYSSYVATAVKLGIVKGRSDKSFAPNDSISREEMAVMIIRAYEVKKGTTSETVAEPFAFTDSKDISNWAAASVAAAAELGLVQGTPEGSFIPKGKMTRAESAKVIYNLLGK